MLKWKRRETLEPQDGHLLWSRPAPLQSRGPLPSPHLPSLPSPPRCRIVNITKLQKVSLMYRHYFRRMFLYFETKVCNFFIWRTSWFVLSSIILVGSFASYLLAFIWWQGVCLGTELIALSNTAAGVYFCKCYALSKRKKHKRKWLFFFFLPRPVLLPKKKKDAIKWWQLLSKQPQVLKSSL